MWTSLLYGVVILQIRKCYGSSFDAGSFTNPFLSGYHHGYQSQFGFGSYNPDPTAYTQDPSQRLESLPGIDTYRPSFNGKDYNEYPHILPPGGKPVELLQQEADLRLEKMLVQSRENEKSVAEKVNKLKVAYGYGTIGYPGYQAPFRYGPIDLGTHQGQDLGSTIPERSGNYRLPVQTVTVTKTIGVRLPQPFPVRHDVPVPAPYPVPVSIHGNSYHNSFGGLLRPATPVGTGGHGGSAGKTAILFRVAPQFGAHHK